MDGIIHRDTRLRVATVRPCSAVQAAPKGSRRAGGGILQESAGYSGKAGAARGQAKALPAASTEAKDAKRLAVFLWSKLYPRIDMMDVRRAWAARKGRLRAGKATAPHNDHSDRASPVRHLNQFEKHAMRDAMIERELNEHTMAAVWRYLKTIAWIHLQGLLAETPTK